MLCCGQVAPPTLLAQPCLWRIPNARMLAVNSESMRTCLPSLEHVHAWKCLADAVVHKAPMRSPTRPPPPILWGPRTRRLPTCLCMCTELVCVCMHGHVLSIHAGAAPCKTRERLIGLQHPAGPERGLLARTLLPELRAAVRKPSDAALLTCAHARRALVHELKHARAQLQAQVRGMTAAEQQLTEHLKATHAQIDEQLQQLREQLKVRGGHCKELWAKTHFRSCCAWLALRGTASCAAAAASMSALDAHACVGRGQKSTTHAHRLGLLGSSAASKLCHAQTCASRRNRGRSCKRTNQASSAPPLQPGFLTPTIATIAVMLCP